MILLNIKPKEVKVVGNGITVVTLPCENLLSENTLEHNRRSYFYLSTLWLVSILALIRNLTQAIFIKIFKKRDSLRKILWDMGRDPKHISSFAVDRFSKFNHQAKWGAARWYSLDLFYNYHKKIRPQLDGNLEGWLTRYWIEKMENRQAVTNRLKVVVDLLVKAFSQFINEPEVRLLSIASGSAQAVIEAILKSPQNVRVVLLDIDPTAIEEAKRSVREAGLEDRFSFICDSTRVLEKVCADFKPHIIEMVGFLDYRPKKQAIKLIRLIKNCLVPGGIFLTCNIRKNREKIFLDWVLLWPMIYRNERQLGELLLEGGFSSERINIIYEPFKIHGIAIAQKLA
jgi:SAM-dependent methyltransferase